MDPAERSVLVVGVGNLLLGDEGVGVHVARALLARADELPASVAVIEAGTAFLDVVGELPHPTRVIVVDAVCAGGTPGTVYRLERPTGFGDQDEPGRRISLHQWGLLETLEAARMLGLEPRSLTIVGIEPATLEPGTHLSPAVAGAAGRVVEMLLADLGADPIEASSGDGTPELKTFRGSPTACRGADRKRSGGHKLGSGGW